ncbi:small multidrug resistance pump [Sulfitobacter brevis]|uniref:Small multidrug resistance pump n=1 Tax=Sulfitobacter brevis TaxID=74348 RepID=A0A1I2CR25_9RHOB|nr:SMR family transporter [Sulfitobacter brevis]SFE70190.1 small multidrug resistance pump [Sulfitobacter brevis]
MPVQYLILFFAILAETIGTTALQASHQFTRVGPAIVTVIAYGISFYLLSFLLKTMPVGIVYAIWSGLGIVLIAGIGFVLFGQRLDLPAILGLLLIVAGITVIHLFSTATPH